LKARIALMTAGSSLGRCARHKYNTRNWKASARAVPAGDGVRAIVSAICASVL